MSLTANPTSVATGGTSTLTWTTTNATSCTASGGWSGSQTLNGSATTATQIVDAPGASAPAPATAFARSTTQVLNIVTAGNAVTAGTKAMGGFFPNGLNGLFS